MIWIIVVSQRLTHFSTSKNSRICQSLGRKIFDQKIAVLMVRYSADPHIYGCSNVGEGCW